MAEVTLEEIEQSLTAAPEPPKAADIKLDASDLPDFAKGKTAADLAAEVSRLQAGLRVSEEARLALTDAARARESIPSAPAAPVEVPRGPTEMTREQLQELMQTDPMAVVDYMSVHLTSRLDTHLNDRFRPIVEGTVNSAESAARSKYATEFELFGDQIKQLKTKVNPNILGTAAGWDDMISYIRGLPQNFDKLIERRTATVPVAARQEQAANTGFTVRAPVAAPAVPTVPTDLDATQLEICKVMGIDPADYKKYM